MTDTQHTRIPLRQDATDLAEHVSDAVATIDGRISARDIAEMYIDINLDRSRRYTEDELKRYVGDIAQQVRYYL